jgi:hypothetical protein
MLLGMRERRSEKQNSQLEIDKRLRALPHAKPSNGKERKQYRKKRLCRPITKRAKRTAGDSVASTHKKELHTHSLLLMTFNKERGV